MSDLLVIACIIGMWPLGGMLGVNIARLVCSYTDPDDRDLRGPGYAGVAIFGTLAAVYTAGIWLLAT